VPPWAALWSENTFALCRGRSAKDVTDVMTDAVAGQPVVVCIACLPKVIETTVALVGVLVHRAMYNRLADGAFLPFRDPADPAQHALNECVAFLHVLGAPMLPFSKFSMPAWRAKPATEGVGKVYTLAEPLELTAYHAFFKWQGDT